MKKGKQSKIPLKADDKELIESLTANLQSAQNKKEKAQTTDEKLAAASALDEAKAAIKQVQYYG